MAITEARGSPRGEVSGLGGRQAHRVSSRPVQLLVSQTRERAIAFNEGYGVSVCGGRAYPPLD